MGGDAPAIVPSLSLSAPAAAPASIAAPTFPDSPQSGRTVQPMANGAGAIGWELPFCAGWSFNRAWISQGSLGERSGISSP